MSGVAVARRSRLAPAGIVLDDAVAYWKASSYSGSGDLLDLSPNGHHARLGSASGVDANDPLFLARPGPSYVYFPGTASNSLSVPNPVALAEYVVTYDDLTTVTRTSAANPLILGTTDVDFAGLKVRTIEVRNGVAGPVVGMFSAALATAPFAAYVDPQGNTWTFNRSTSGRKLAVVDRALFLLGTDDYLNIPNHADLNFGAADSFAVALVMRTYGLAATSGLLAKRSTTAGGAGTTGWSLSSTTALAVTLRADDGTVNEVTTLPSMVAGQVATLVAVRDVGADTFLGYTNGTPGSANPDSTTASFTNTDDVRVGRLAAGGTSYADMEFIAAAVLRRPLSPGAVHRLAIELAA